MQGSNFGRNLLVLSLGWFTCASVALAQAMTGPQTQATNTGISGLWVLANISYAGMRAQGSSSGGWRVLAFIFGLPGTIISFFTVTEGSDRAYGVDLPRKGRS
jgi:hypothetical protein